MLGDHVETDLLASDEVPPRERWGIIPRAVEELFERLGAGGTAVVHMSYMQIYNDKLYDLLQDRARRRPLTVHEAASRGEREVYVRGLAEYRYGAAPLRRLRRARGG